MRNGASEASLKPEPPGEGMSRGATATSEAERSEAKPEEWQRHDEGTGGEESDSVDEPQDATTNACRRAGVRRSVSPSEADL